MDAALKGGEEKKSKASWGAQIVDYEKIAAAAVQTMKAADLNRFLVVCALVSDLYCAGYNPSQALAKDSNLASIAGRYKLDAGKITTAVRTELSSKTNIKESNTGTVKRSGAAKSSTRKASKQK